MSSDKYPLIKDGWQCWIYIYDSYVIKVVKSYEEANDSVLEAFRGKIDKEKLAEKESKRVLDDILKSKIIINQNNFPLKLMAYPEFLSEGKIKQARADELRERILSLNEKGNLEELKKLVERFLDLILELWKYGIHEKTGKMGENYGVLNGEVVLIDLFELSGNKEKVRKQIRKNYLEKNTNLRLIPEQIKEYFVMRSRDKINEKNLGKLWKKKV